MIVTVSEFKAKCLGLFDLVHDRGETIVVTKRGRVVARVVAPAGDEHKPWLRVRGTASWKGDPFEPVVDESDIEALG
jgi:antitoxin (DNA-binding transcriptional repressor) of toxin-antitoxin stability system